MMKRWGRSMYFDSGLDELAARKDAYQAGWRIRSSFLNA